MKFKKKPVVIEAIPWNSEENIKAIKEWLGDNLISEARQGMGTVGYWVKTLEGNMMISWGDYIIQGVNGEFYPCKPDIFEKTYEKAPDEEFYEWNITLGDSSGDGHGIHETYIVRSNKPFKDVVEAYNKAKEVSGINFAEYLCDEYEDGVLHDDQFDLFKKVGMDMSLYENCFDEDGSIFIDEFDYLCILFEFIKLGDPDLKLKIVPDYSDNFISAEPNYFGYGLFTV